MTHHLTVLASRSDVEERVAAELVSVMADAIRQRGRADIVVTGGTVGIGTLAAVRKTDSPESIDWNSVHVWWGDERFVPADHADRNDRQAMDALFDHVPIPPSNLHAFPANDGHTVDEARDSFVRSNPEGFPVFDVVLNGIGPDGHVASLFPGLHHGDGVDVIAVHDSPKPPAERLSFTFRVLNNARAVWIVAAGEDKADAIYRVMSDSPQHITPANGLSIPAGVIVWADALAASRVTN